MENRTFEVTGQPLADLGLQCAVIVHADGHREPLKGFAVPPGVTIQDALTRSLPEGASLIIEHDWIPHYRFGENTPTNYVCSQCPALRFDELTAAEKSAKLQTTSHGKLYGKSVIYGKEDEHATPYMTRYWFGRLRLHIFHRGDQDPDCHDHPWDFWTFPLTPYVEEVAEPYTVADYADEHDPAELGVTPRKWKKRRQIVPAWRLSFRPATHCHRVLHRMRRINPKIEKGYMPDDKGNYYVDNPGAIITFVWRSADKRKWGFLKDRDGKWCWVHWKSYVFGGGKNAPCE